MKPDSERKALDWRNVFSLVEKKVEPVVCFKITPDKSITNYSNYKFFKDVSELERINNLKDGLRQVGGLCKSLLFRKKREGFKVIYRAQTDYVWYEILIRKNAINFYVLCFESNKDFVKLKLEQVFPHAPIEEVDEEETKIPEENTMIADLKLQRHNFFSIYTNYQEQAQPIEDILASAEDVREDDVLKFSLRVQPYDRNYWSYKAEEWETRVRKGSTPKRLRVDKAGVLNGLFGVSEFAFQKLGQLFKELHTIAFRKNNPNQITIRHSDTERREIGEISRQTHYKMTAPVFRTVMRVASHSKDSTRRNMNLKSLSSSFIDVKDTNNAIVRTAIYEAPETSENVSKSSLIQKLLKRDKEPVKERETREDWNWRFLHDEVSNHKITPLTHLDIDYNILCDKELGKIKMLPTAKIQKKYKDKMGALSKTENQIPKEYLTGEGVPLGEVEFKGKRYPISIPDNNPDTWALPILISGMQGVGKDTVGVNWVYENNKRGRSAVILDIIDEKGRGMTDVFKTIIKPENLILLDFSHPEVTPYLDWKEGMKSENRFTKNRLASELAKFFESTDDGAGLQTERYLRNCVKALPSVSLIEQSMILISDEVREKAIKDCENRGDVSTANFWKLYNEESEGRRKQISAPVFNRLSKLIDDLALKPIFGQLPNGSIDFDKWTSEGKVIVCKIPKVAFGTAGIRTLSHWITVKTWLTKQIQLDEDRKCETILLINEPHQVMYKGMENTLLEIYPEARKHGLQVVTLFHDIAQVPKDLFDIMLASGANFILYKQKTDKAWKRLGNRVTDSYSVDECMRMRKFESMVGFLVDVDDLPVIRVNMYDMVQKRGGETYDNTEVVERCIKDYHRPIEEVEKELLELEEKMFSKKKKK